jgi:type VI secretion system secreted protein VgrG
VYPKRAFTQQYAEDDAAFIARHCKRAGISWYFRPGPVRSDDDTPWHQAVFFDSGMKLPQNGAAEIRYHRQAATEKRDSIFHWAAERTLVPGVADRKSWDYKTTRVTELDTHAMLDQGEVGNEIAWSLRDTHIDIPHAGSDLQDAERLTRLAIQRHEFEGKCVRGMSGVRDLGIGWSRISEHPELDGHSPEEREYLFVDVHHLAENNLPKQLNERAQALLAASERIDGWIPSRFSSDEHRYLNRFIAVRRDTPIVPAFDPTEDLPAVHPTTAVVVGPPGEVVHTDELGRVKVRFVGLDPRDHAHAQGAGTNDNDGDSAWVRNAGPWAGSDMGILFPLRGGMEVVIQWMNGDPDRPVITNVVYNGLNRPPRFSHAGGLPGNRYLSGIKSQEVRGHHYNQLRFDDTTGQPSAQLASEHRHSELNLGDLTHPRVNGTGEARGEGAEVRTDGQVAFRGAQGVLVSAHARPAACGTHMDRPELIGLVDALHGVVQELGTLSAKHLAEGTDGKRLADLAQRLKEWSNGTSVAPQAAGGCAPMVAVTAPSSIGIGSQDNLLLGAQTHVDVASVGNTQLSAGRRLLLRTGELLSAFARQGMRLITATGKLVLQAQSDDVQITGKRVLITGTEELVYQAPKVRVIADGAQYELAAGSIVHQCTSGYIVKSASFSHVGPGNGAPEKVALLQSDTPHNQRVQLIDLMTREPLANQRYRARLEDGQVIEGTTDAQGMTQMLKSRVAFAGFRIEVLESQ